MPAMYGIMKRDETDQKNIKWFKLPNHYVYHFVNAWDSKNDKGEDIVTMYGCALNKVKLEFKHKNNRLEEEHPFLWESAEHKNQGRLTKYVFNLTTGEHSMDQLLDLATDFPLIDMDLVGYKNKYAYMTYFSDEIPTEKNGVYS